MKERPILFSSSMVLAILENRKTQTRRVVNNILHETIESEPDLVDCVLDWDGGPSRLDMMSNGTECCPYGFVGGRLYVRERTRLIEVDDGCSIVSGVGNHKVRLRYEADGTESDWLPYPDRLAALEVGQCVANGCYREAARIWLEVMAVRVQRLQEIRGEDALAEGCTIDSIKEWLEPDEVPDFSNRVARIGFRWMWDSINSKRPGCSWADNPWCWAITFCVVK